MLIELCNKILLSTVKFQAVKILLEFLLLYFYAHFFVRYPESITTPLTNAPTFYYQNLWELTNSKMIVAIIQIYLWHDKIQMLNVRISWNLRFRIEYISVPPGTDLIKN